MLSMAGDIQFAGEPADAVRCDEFRLTLHCSLSGNPHKETTSLTGLIDVPTLCITGITDKRIGHSHHDRFVNVAKRPIIKSRLSQFAFGTWGIRIVSSVTSCVAVEQPNLKLFVAFPFETRCRIVFRSFASDN